MRQPTPLLLAALLTACQPEAAPPPQPAAVRPITAPNHEPVVNMPPSEGAVLQQTSNGYSHCELIEGGDVQCWGRNRYGQLGDGTFEARGTPRVILRGAVQIAMRELTSCALLRDGAVYCWGAHPGVEAEPLPDTQLRREYLHSWRLQSARPRPTRVEGLPPARLIAAARSQTCALTTDGEVYCWGVDLERASRGPSRGALTIADSALRSARMRERGLLAPAEAGRLFISHTPQRLEALSGSDMLWSGADHHCARSTLGQVRCWGQRVVAPGIHEDIHSQPTRAPLLDHAQQLVFDEHVVYMLRAGEAFELAQRDWQAVALSAPSPIRDISKDNHEHSLGPIMLTTGGELLHIPWSDCWPDSLDCLTYTTLLTGVDHLNNPGADTPCVTLRDGATTCANPRRHPTNEARSPKGRRCGDIPIAE